MLVKLKMLLYRFKQTDWLNVSIVGILLFVIAIAITLLGHYDQYDFGINTRQLFHDLYANVGAEMASIAVTILIIDKLNQRRDTRQERERLIRHMASIHPITALQAVEDLRLLGWLEDGSLKNVPLRRAALQGVDLVRANLEGVYLLDANLEGARLLGTNLKNADMFQANLKSAVLQDANLVQVNLARARLQGADLRRANLSRANLTGADLQGANLEGANLTSANLQQANLNKANLTDAQLQQVHTLKSSKMPDGSQYNGYLNLAGDIQHIRQVFGIDITQSEDMATWYGVSLVEYEYGQQRANNSVKKLE